MERIKYTGNLFRIMHVTITKNSSVIKGSKLCNKKRGEREGKRET